MTATAYYVLTTLGPHSKGDVITFSAEQLGAGIDIARLEALGALRVAAGGEIARVMPAQVQAANLFGVGNFTTDATPTNGTSGTYATLAPYGAVLYDVSQSPPTEYVNTGTQQSPTWTAAGGGTSLPGAASNPIIPQDTIFAGNVTVDADLTSGSPDFQTIGQWTISQDGAFYQYIYDNNNYPIQTTIADSGDPIPGRTPYTGDIYRILGTVRGRIWGIDATNGDMASVGGLGLHGHAAQSTPRTLAQSVITAITDANAKTAMKAVANVLADIGALTIT